MPGSKVKIRISCEISSSEIQNRTFFVTTQTKSTESHDCSKIRLHSWQRFVFVDAIYHSNGEITSGEVSGHVGKRWGGLFKKENQNVREVEHGYSTLSMQFPSHWIHWNSLRTPSHIQAPCKLTCSVEPAMIAWWLKKDVQKIWMNSCWLILHRKSRFHAIETSKIKEYLERIFQ